MQIIMHKVHPESMLDNPEILDVDFWLDDGSFCRARLNLVHSELMETRAVYELAYLLDSELRCSHKAAVAAVEKYLNFKRYEIAHFWIRAILGSIGVLLALFLIL